MLIGHGLALGTTKLTGMFGTNPPRLRYTYPTDTRRIQHTRSLGIRLNIINIININKWVRCHRHYAVTRISHLSHRSLELSRLSTVNQGVKGGRTCEGREGGGERAGGVLICCLPNNSNLTIDLFSPSRKRRRKLGDSVNHRRKHRFGFVQMTFSAAVYGTHLPEDRKSRTYSRMGGNLMKGEQHTTT